MELGDAGGRGVGRLLVSTCCKIRIVGSIGDPERSQGEVAQLESTRLDSGRFRSSPQPVFALFRVALLSDSVCELFVLLGSAGAAGELAEALPAPPSPHPLLLRLPNLTLPTTLLRAGPPPCRAACLSLWISPHPLHATPSPAASLTRLSLHPTAEHKAASSAIQKQFCTAALAAFPGSSTQE